MEDRIDRLERAERELERVEAQRDKLREACLDLLSWHDALADPQWDGSPSQKRARAALAETEEDGE